MLPDRTGREQLAVKLVTVLETPRRHPARGTHAVGGLVRIRNVERPVFAAKEARGREGLDLFALTDVEALADVDERGHRRVQRPKRARDDSAQVRARDGLRRLVAC